MYPYLNIHSAGEQLLQAFSWMLVHSLWQGLLLAVVTALLLQLARRARAQWRYNIVFIQFVLFILICTWTFIRGMNAPSGTMVPLAGTIGQNASLLLNLDADNVQQFADTCAAYISTHASVLVLVWALFFSFRSFRMVQGLIFLQKTRHKHTYAPAGWNERLAQLCNKLHVNTSIRLLESALVKVPVVIGHLKPVILMPAGLLTGMPAEQVEAVLLHELAHIRRHDYIVNLLQTFFETIYFFNPGLLWISALLRDEREHCCDDIALGQTGNKKEFIQALISFKEHAMYNSHQSAVAFPGKKNQLLQRVSRIINNKNQSLGTGEKIFFMAGIILLSAILSTAAITQLRSSAPDLSGELYTAKDSSYMPPVQQAPAVVKTESIQPKKPPVKATARKGRRTPDATVATLSVSGPSGTIVMTADVAEEDHRETLQADNVQQEQPEDDRRSDEEIRYTHRGTSTFAQRQSQLKNGRRQFVQENYRRLNRLTAFQPTAGENAVLRATNEEWEHRKEEARLARIQMEKDRRQADLDRIQAERDRQQAVRDKIQADKDRQQADRDREQAIRDRAQAEKDRHQAELDRLQAAKDRAEADRKRRIQYPVI